MAAAVLELQHLVKQFGAHRALDDLSLDVFEGEVFTLLGPSGCGKTTTLRILAGLESPDSGRVLLRGKPLVSVSDGVFVSAHKRNMGMVFQSYAIWPHKTVFENVAYPLRVRRTKSAEVQRRVKAVLGVVGLEGLEDRPGPQLSGGQQQRVALARALVYEPSVLLLDEPFSNLDAKLREQMRVQVKLLLSHVNVTAIFVTHDQDEALSLSDRIALMNGGRVEQIGSPRDLYERPSTTFVRDFLGHAVLLEGVVGSRTEQQLCIRLCDFADSVMFAPGSQTGAVTEGQRVLVSIRPEDVQVVPDGISLPGPNEFVGAVETALFMGDHLEYRVRVGRQQTISLHAPRSTVADTGTQVRLSVPAERVTVWPQ